MARVTRKGPYVLSHCHTNYYQKDRRVWPCGDFRDLFVKPFCKTFLYHSTEQTKRTGARGRQTFFWYDTDFLDFFEKKISLLTTSQCHTKRRTGATTLGPFCITVQYRHHCTEENIFLTNQTSPYIYFGHLIAVSTGPLRFLIFTIRPDFLRMY